MPRSLPWLRGGASGQQTVRKSRINSATPRPKRPRPLDSSDVETELPLSTKQTKPRNEARAPSTSPPAQDIPCESFMVAGTDGDDRFRMVEDEFLEIAKLFTQHLHEAEYRRMREAARKQHADAITSISRPVTQKMSDSTRRKVDGIARAETQAAAVNSLLAKNDKSDDNASDEDNAWIGTALHGLMDSPRKSSSSLLKVGSINVSTRAAAGFRRPKTHLHVKQEPSSPTPVTSKPVTSKRHDITSHGGDQESSADENDLDGPLTRRTLESSARKIRDWSTNPGQKHIAFSFDPSLAAPSDTGILEPTGTKSSKGQSMKQASSEHGQAHPAVDVAARIARRLEHAKSQKLKREAEDLLEVDDIPVFL